MLNLSQFIIYSLWFGFISNAWWAVATFGGAKTGPLPIFAFFASAGWLVMFGFLLLKHLDDT